MTPAKALAELLTTRKAFSDPIRESGRQVFSDLVGRAVYRARRPAGTAAIAATIHRSGGELYPHLTGFAGCSAPVFTVGLWLHESEQGRTEDIESAWNAMRDVLLGYRGIVSGFQIHGIMLEQEPFETTTLPIPGVHQWVFHLQSEWRVLCSESRPAAVNYQYSDVR